MRAARSFRATAILPARDSNSAPSSTVRHMSSMDPSCSRPSISLAPPILLSRSCCLIAFVKRTSLYLLIRAPLRRILRDSSRCPHSSSILDHSSHPWLIVGYSLHTFAYRYFASSYRLFRFNVSATSINTRHFTFSGILGISDFAYATASTTDSPSLLLNSFTKFLYMDLLTGDSTCSCRFFGDLDRLSDPVAHPTTSRCWRLGGCCT
mmetsp:Transcript_10471/g.15964  ORF Transcript_10471/g.15964 Transcript_10471/m.15964 type:complete len:208 (-) Transcript_10471:1263-1886(-)